MVRFIALFLTAFMSIAHAGIENDLGDCEERSLGKNDELANVVTYKRDRNHHIVETTTVLSGGMTLVETYQWDGTGRIATSFTWTYDTKQRRITQTTDSGRITYRYDCK